MPTLFRHATQERSTTIKKRKKKKQTKKKNKKKTYTIYNYIYIPLLRYKSHIYTYRHVRIVVVAYKINAMQRKVGKKDIFHKVTKLHAQEIILWTMYLCIYITTYIHRTHMFEYTIMMKKEREKEKNVLRL